MDKNLVLKIKKLMALADGQASKEESASALGKAQALMLKHKINVAMLEEVTDEDKEEAQIFDDSPLNEEDAGKRKKAFWKVALTQTLCDFNGCFTYGGSGNIYLAGKPSDVDTIRYMYGYCVRAIDRLTKKDCRGQGRTYSNNFRYGCVEAIKKAMQAEQDALRAEFEAANCSERSLVIVNNTLIQIKRDQKDADRLATVKLKLRKKSGTRYYGNDKARAAGEAAGGSIYKGKGTGRLGTPQKRIN